MKLSTSPANARLCAAERDTDKEVPFVDDFTDLKCKRKDKIGRNYPGPLGKNLIRWKLHTMYVNR